MRKVMIGICCAAITVIVAAVVLTRAGRAQAEAERPGIPIGVYIGPHGISIRCADMSQRPVLVDSEMRCLTYDNSKDDSGM